jgi:hypothetical protein
MPTQQRTPLPATRRFNLIMRMLYGLLGAYVVLELGMIPHTIYGR